MQPLVGSYVSGTCTIMVTRGRPASAPSSRCDVDEGTIVVVDRGAPQLLGRRMDRINETGWSAGEACFAETGGQQVIGDAIIMGVDNIAGCSRRPGCKAEGSHQHRRKKTDAEPSHLVHYRLLVSTIA